jgi:hypothetical protein
MSKLILCGWEVGFNKVGLNRLLREHFGYSLGRAKEAVDAILENRHIDIDVSSEKLKEIEMQLNALRVRFNIQ